ncbi:MAG TPA: hypothetical protein VER55_15485, partial [Ardenticatenaceae bacterium]|nr:hypothetical protein [Ardenticatenaceae bacterium]
MRKAATLALALAAAIGSWAWFGRDPERLAPELPDLILAPADGRVVAVRPGLAPRWLTGQVWRVAIFLSL